MCVCLACGRSRADQEHHVKMQEIYDYFTSALLLIGSLPKDSDSYRMNRYIDSEGRNVGFANYIVEWYFYTKTSPENLKSPIDRREFRKLCATIASRWQLSFTYDRLEHTLFSGPVEEYTKNVAKFTNPSG